MKRFLAYWLIVAVFIAPCAISKPVVAFASSHHDIIQVDVEGHIAPIREEPCENHSIPLSNFHEMCQFDCQSWLGPALPSAHFRSTQDYDSDPGQDHAIHSTLPTIPKRLNEPQQDGDRHYRCARISDSEAILALSGRLRL